MSALEQSLESLSAELAAGKTTSSAITNACFDAIAARDGQVRAFLSLDEAGARVQAAESDARRARGAALGPLDGVPLVIKDNILTQGVRTTAGSKMLDGFVPQSDATVVARLKRAGAVLLGKTNLDEFGMGSSTELSAFHPTHNPYDLARTPGGSSGGSAAAVAARFAFGALGTDTGGSIRQPAAFTHCVGLKPTYGRVSRAGVVAYASSLDQVGPLARSCRDAALIFEAIAGADPLDSTTAARDASTSSRNADVRGLRIGLPAEYFSSALDAEVRAAVDAAAERLRSLGAELVEVSLPHTKAALAAYYVIAPCEASSNLARYDGVRFGHRTASPKNLAELYTRSRSEGFGAEVKRRIMLGTFALSAGYADAYYGKAQRVRRLIRGDFEQAFTKVDVLLSAASPVLPWRLGEKLADPLAMYAMDVLTVPINLAGVPALVVPVGASSAGLPLGVQLIGRPFDEATLFRVGTQLEAAPLPPRA